MQMQNMIITINNRTECKCCFNKGQREISRKVFRMSIITLKYCTQKH